MNTQGAGARGRRAKRTTQAEMAKLSGCSRRSIQYAEAILRFGDENLIAEIRNGVKGASTVYREVLRRQLHVPFRTVIVALSPEELAKIVKLADRFRCTPEDFVKAAVCRFLESDDPEFERIPYDGPPPRVARGNSPLLRTRQYEAAVERDGDHDLKTEMQAGRLAVSAAHREMKNRERIPRYRSVLVRFSPYELARIDRVRESKSRVEWILRAVDVVVTVLNAKPDPELETCDSN